VAAGADAVMTAHIELPALDPAPNTPTTLSAPIVQGLLRKELGFDGLIYTDSMGMAGVAALYTPGEAAVRAVKAGNDVILHSPDDGAAFRGIVDAVKAGEIPEAQINASVERILRAKARANLHRNRMVNLDQISTVVGTRRNQAVADDVSRRSITLVKDTRGQVPLKIPRDAQVLYLSVLDFPSGWRIAAPSRTFIPELRERWPNVTAIELSDRTTPSELELVRAMAPRFDVVIASVFVRAGSASGRMDLAEPLQRLLSGFARSNRPLVTVFFGNPYVPMYMPDLPTVMLTYDFYDRAEASAVKALAGEIPIRGRLPIELPGYAKVGDGIDRPAITTSAR
jgi:beta-N-acetylhexosaminidase